MKKKLLSLLLVCTLVLGMIPGAALAAETKSPFTDVKTTDWFFDAVQYAYDHNLMSGTGNNCFSPSETTTRGMMVTILHNMEGKPAAGSPAFTDVPAGEWYAAPVAWASAHGIVSGYGNGRFGPNDPITREQMVTILYQYARYKNYELTVTGDISTFDDYDETSAYAVTPFNWAIGKGLIAGVGDDLLDPTGNAERSHIAAIMKSFCVCFAQMGQTVLLSDLSVNESFFVVNESSTATFTVKVSGSPRSVTLCSDSKMICEMYDNGKNGDSEAGDGKYSCTINLESVKASVNYYYAKIDTSVSNKVKVYFISRPTANSKSNIEELKNNIDKIESKYLYEGFVSENKSEDLLNEIENFCNIQYEQNNIIEIIRDTNSITMKLASGLSVFYAPKSEGVDSIGSSLSLSIITCQPSFMDMGGNGFTTSNYDLPEGIPYVLAMPDYAATDIAEKFGFIFSNATNFNDDGVTLDLIRSLKENQIVIWHGHGGHDLLNHSILLTGDDFDFNAYLYDLSYWWDCVTNRIIRVGDKMAISSKFVDKYCNNLTGSLLYLAACESGKDNVLADSFINKGAFAVVGNTDTIVRDYNVILEYTTFEYMTQISPATGKYYTLSHALSKAKEKYGLDDKSYGGIGATPLVFGGETALNFRFSQYNNTITIEGTIVDSSTRQGIDGAKVSIYLGLDLLQTKTTDEKGDFSSDGFAFEMNETNLAKLKLVIEKEGYLTLTTPVSMAIGNQGGAGEWDLGVFELTPIKITPANITGVVRRDLDLNSLSGVSVYLNCLFGAGGEDIGATSITDKEGKFTIEVPDNATALTSLRFEKEGYESYTYLLPSNADASVNVGVIRLKLKPIEIFTASISGIVSDASSNQAVENATVEFYNGESKVSTETTNSGGSFYAAILTPGTYSIRVTKSGYQSYETTLTVENGKNSQIEISLVPVSSEKVVYVSNAEQFNAIRNNLDAHYILTSDINLSGYSTWKPIGTTKKPFTGILDGNGHTITGVKITSFDLSEEIESKGSTGYCGAALFGTVSSGGVIQNVEIKNASIQCDSGYDLTCYALLVGKLFGESKVDNCTVSGSINLSSPGCYVGGVVSYATDSEIINSRSNTNIVLYAQLNSNANSFAGGVVGYSNSGSIRHCRNEGNISMNIRALDWAASVGVSESTGVGGVVGFGLAEDSCNTASRLTLSGNVPIGECGRISGIRLNGRNVNCVSYSETLVNGNRVSSSDASSIHGRDISSLQSVDEWYNQ